MQYLGGYHNAKELSDKLTRTKGGSDQNSNHSTREETLTQVDNRGGSMLSHTTESFFNLSSDITFRSTNSPVQDSSYNDTGQERHLLRHAGLFPSAVSNKTRTNALINGTQVYVTGSKALLIPSTAQYMAATDASRNMTSYVSSGLSVSPVDVVIVTMILITWFVVIGLFINKWQHLRIVEPREYRFQHKPKNLDSIKIVQRPSDSIIYRAYPDAMTRTMAARQKRLERMQTMPAIKVDLTTKSPAEKVRRELEGHIPILCLHSMEDLETVSDEEANEKDNMLRPIEV